MKRYNKNKDLKPDLKKRIEEYFQFRWDENRMAAIDEDEEKDLLEQLPSTVQDKLLASFIFNDFTKKFR